MLNVLPDRAIEIENMKPVARSRSVKKRNPAQSETPVQAIPAHQNKTRPTEIRLPFRTATLFQRWRLLVHQTALQPRKHGKTKRPGVSAHPLERGRPGAKATQRASGQALFETTFSSRFEGAGQHLRILSCIVVQPTRRSRVCGTATAGPAHDCARRAPRLGGV